MRVAWVGLPPAIGLERLPMPAADVAAAFLMAVTVVGRALLPPVVEAVLTRLADPIASLAPLVYPPPAGVADPLLAGVVDDGGIRATTVRARTEAMAACVDRATAPRVGMAVTGGPSALTAGAPQLT